MQPIQKVYISGLGAIGSAYAAKLYDMAPQSVTAIASQDRIERFGKLGVTVNGKSYPFNFVDPRTIPNPKPADLIIAAVKQHHLLQSIEDFRPFVGPETIILSLLNGITSEEIIGREYGMEKLLYSFVVGTDAVREGTATRYSKIGRIVFGDRVNTTHTPKVTAVRELFDRAQIPYQIPENMLRELWWKFMMNVGINQVSAILKAPYGVFQQIKPARELMVMASREVLELSQKIGINLEEGDIQKYLQVADTLAPEGKTSMLQDVEAGRKTEVEIFAGTVIELGQKYGIQTPINQVLLRMIQTIEQTYPVSLN